MTLNLDDWYQISKKIEGASSPMSYSALQLSFSKNFFMYFMPFKTALLRFSLCACGNDRKMRSFMGTHVRLLLRNRVCGRTETP